MSNIEPKGSRKTNNGWLVMMVDGKKRLGLNEREIRASENRKRIALREDLKFKRRHTKRERKPAQSKYQTGERVQGVSRNRMHLSLMHEVKMAKKRVTKMEPSSSATWQVFGGSIPSPKKDIKSTKPAEFVWVKLEEATSLGYNKPKEVKSKSNLICKASDLREEEEQPPLITRDNSLNPWDVKLGEATSLGRKQKGNRTKALSHRSLPRENSGKNPIPLEVTLKEVKTRSKSYRTQVFMDWKKKARSSRKRYSDSTSASKKRLTGLDPDVIAQTQREIAEFAEKENESSGLILTKELTGVHGEGESKSFMSGWLEDVEGATAVGGLY